MPRSAHAVHALLSLVPDESETRLEASERRTELPFLPLGCRSRFLAVLSLVHQGVAAMTTRAEHEWLYLGETDLASADHDLPHGSVSIRSMRAPDKETANEDAAAVISFGSNALILAVADGVGGTPAGREASNRAVKTLSRVLAETEAAPDNLRPAILDALEEANRSIINSGRGAATTLVVGEIVDGQVRSYHVGDSELISVGQRGRVKLRITPHSPTGFAVEAGLLDEDEAVQHDQRHLLFNVIGTADMRIEVGAPTRMDARDTVLLASDGLMDNLYIDEILEVVRKGPLPEAADELMKRATGRMAREAGGQPSKPDDLTVVLFRRRPAT
jgi:serine/threonine protein phosphatase PrpC